MHGRVKVKTSEQEQEEKRKEREKKLKIYRAGYNRICEKRNQGEYDEEILTITGQLLCSNPDIYTLWNIRREFFNVIRETKTADELEEIFTEELKLIESALRSNPKSYGAWYHRMWVIEAMKNPPIARDLMLCSKLLSSDARNFHCWDYRRWLTLTLESGSKDKVELEFSFNKLTENFSNYSAWHYRTLFLPRIFKDESAPCSITCDQHAKELDLVQNAVFTDPADQSAWFYLRWLLGKGDASKPQLVAGTLQWYSGNVVYASLALTKAEKPSVPGEKSSLSAMLKIKDKVIQGQWRCSGSLKHSHIWELFPDQTENSEAFQSVGPEMEGNMKEMDAPRIILLDGSEQVDVLYLSRDKGSLDKHGFVEWMAQREGGDALSWGEGGGNLGKGLTTSLLEDQLELCHQLLELEPESKWTLLTEVQLLRALKNRSSGPKKLTYSSQIMEYLEKLKCIDSLRSGFYSDLYSDCILDSALDTERVQPSFVDLSSLNLTTLPSPTVPLPIPILLATKIDLSGNISLSLPCVRPGSLSCLSHLPRLRHLCLGVDVDKLASSGSSVVGMLPSLPHVLHFELIPDSPNGDWIIPPGIAAGLSEIMPQLQTMKPC